MPFTPRCCWFSSIRHLTRCRTTEGSHHSPKSSLLHPKQLTSFFNMLIVYKTAHLWKNCIVLHKDGTRSGAQWGPAHSRAGSSLLPCLYTKFVITPPILTLICFLWVFFFFFVGFPPNFTHIPLEIYRNPQAFLFFQVLRFSHSPIADFAHGWLVF